jgi:rare lipoprotein A
VRPPSSVAPSPLTPSRSDRGNPPFYDVLGKRYHVLESSDGYRAKGVASWYGGDFHGLSTSSGETYDMHAMTAAHTTLPIPTWVEVTNLANGKRVIVKVNDRGPFVNNRLIDLSYAAASELDMIRAGTARVEVRALGVPPSSAPRVAVSRTTANVGTVAAPPMIASPPVSVRTADRDQMYVQAGAFSERANAAKLVEQLRVNGFANSFIVSEDRVGGTLHRVRVGPLRDAAEFDRLSGRLRTLGVADSHLVVDR